MNRHIAARRNVVTMSARSGRCQTFFLAAAISAHTIEIALGCVFGRRQKIHPAILCIDSLNADDIVIPGCNRLYFLAVARDGVDVTPTVAFTSPQETLAIV